MNFSMQNVIDGQGLEITIVGITIVFSALAMISLFIAALPRVLTVLDPYLPAAAHEHGHASPAVPPSGEDERIVAAIGLALHHRQQGG